MCYKPGTVYLCATIISLKLIVGGLSHTIPEVVVVFLRTSSHSLTVNYLTYILF